MKNLLLIGLTLTMLNVDAQYFDNKYESFKMGSGLTTVSTGDGHLLAGIVNVNHDISVINTNISGGFSGSNFKKGYHLKYNNHDAVINGAEAIEYANGNAFAVVGSFTTLQDEYGIFYLNLSTSGTVNLVTCYTFTDELTVKSICESTQTAGDIFVTEMLMERRFLLLD